MLFKRQVRDAPVIVQVKEVEAGLGKWTGYAIWDSGTPRVMQLAGKFGQQTRMVITTDFQRKVSRQFCVSQR